MDPYDRHFESFLREFQPRRPRALPVQLGAAHTWVQRLAATVVLATTVGCSLWFLIHEASTDEPASPSRKETGATAAHREKGAPALVPLTRLALEDPVRLDAVLAEASRNALPDLRRKTSTLRLLAKE